MLFICNIIHGNKDNEALPFVNVNVKRSVKLGCFLISIKKFIQQMQPSLDEIAI